MPAVSGPAKPTEAAASEPVATVPNTQAGPVIDLPGHLKDLRRAVIPALIIALVLGGAVGLGWLFIPKKYQQSATAHFVLQSTTTSEAFASAAAAQIVALSGDQDVLQSIADEAGVSSVDEVKASISVAANLAPGMIDVATQASSPEAAQQLVSVTITTLDKFAQSRTGNNPDAESAIALTAKLSEIDAQIRAASTTDPKIIADLYAERQSLAAQQQATLGAAPLRLSLLAMAPNDGSSASLSPLLAAPLAALIAFTLAIEAIVFAKGRIGKTVTPPWSRRISRKLGIQCDSAPITDRSLPVPTEVRIKALRDAGARVLILDAADTETTPTSPATTTSSATTTSPTATKSSNDDPEKDDPDRFELTDQWWDEVDLDSIDLAVVVANTSVTTKSAVLSTFDTLAISSIPACLTIRETTQATGPFAGLKN